MKIIKDSNTLKMNGIYLAALADYTDGHSVILVDDEFFSLPALVQKFIIAHEMGHMNQQRNEWVADSNAIKEMGRIKTLIAMWYLLKYFIKKDWTVAGQYLVRMSYLGYPVNRIKIVAPNGRVFDVKTLKNFYSDNYRKL